MAPLDAENIANHVDDNTVHNMSNRKWTDEQKRRIVEIDEEERKRGRNFMRRIKARWEAEYPESRRTGQNLIDNTKRFKKEGWGRNIEVNGEDNNQVIIEVAQEQRQLEWSTEMKVKLVMVDKEERAKGRGFMKRVKERWDMEYPDYQDASWQKLRDNAARFKKEKEVTNLILVRQREEIHQNMDEQEVEWKCSPRAPK